VTVNELDVRHNHHPKHPRAEFDADHPGSYQWEYLDEGPEFLDPNVITLPKTSARQAV